MYAWTIDRDHTGWTDSGKTIPHNAPAALLAALLKGEGDVFRLLDDDGEVSIVGRIVGDFVGNEPLLDYGGAQGCTKVEFMHNGQFTAL